MVSIFEHSPKINKPMPKLITRKRVVVAIAAVTVFPGFACPVSDLTQISYEAPEYCFWLDFILFAQLDKFLR